jgi:hypothetical protein
MTTLAQQFAGEYAKGVVPAALAAINTVKRNSKRIAVMALLVSTPHQALYLYNLGGHDGLVGVISGVFFALLIPATVDTGIVTMLSVTQTAGITKRAKRRAFGALLVLVGVSVAVNIAAPGPLALRLLTGFTALVLAMVEFVAAAIAPDFAELEQAEQSAAIVPAVDTVAAQKLADRRERDRQRRAAKREADRLAASEAERKAEARREQRRLARQVADLEASFAAESAPVSPAPTIGEQAAYL